MAIIWDNGFKSKPLNISAPIKNPPSLPLEEKEEEGENAVKDYKENKGFGR